jgi:hypothetical protein
MRVQNVCGACRIYALTTVPHLCFFLLIEGETDMSDTTSFSVVGGKDAEAFAAELQRQRDVDAFKVADFQREAARRRGVGFSGSAPLRQPKVRSEEELLTAAKVAFNIRKRFAEASRGRFIQAIANLQKPDGMYAYEADIARKAFHRSNQFDPSGPTFQHEIGVALEALHAIPGADADEARLALAELLMQPVREAA